MRKRRDRKALGRSQDYLVEQQHSKWGSQNLSVKSLEQASGDEHESHNSLLGLGNGNTRKGDN